MSKRKFAASEHELHVELFSKYENILSNKKITLAINKKKADTCNILAEEFNKIRQQETGKATIWTAKQLRSRWLRQNQRINVGCVYCLL